MQDVGCVRVAREDETRAGPSEVGEDHVASARHAKVVGRVLGAGLGGHGPGEGPGGGVPERLSQRDHPVAVGVGGTPQADSLRLWVKNEPPRTADSWAASPTAVEATKAVPCTSSDGSGKSRAGAAVAPFTCVNNPASQASTIATRASAEEVV